ncbi:glycosyltransferase family 39 protein [Cellulomonas sp. URHD0024]|uniref:glycosyltransferase family 39 protein n=1 Tax=Cellulomonas sp. URHD0024 TaxID=1302620 RepID=UPI0004204FD3|nr:glycosyltransferase family 39 protein [Cellulomonas sp. URHD0024]
MTVTTASLAIPDRPDSPDRPDEIAPPAVASARARWERPALAALLLATGLLYLWDLSASGWGNAFYSAAVQAGSESWKAFLYGASDAAASITVDKPPASLWVMALSVRLFGLSSWSILVPQALMGVATVGVLYAGVRRRFSAGAALLAGATLAITPVAALMFRFNNPDALLVLLLTLSVWATMKAVGGPRTTRWMLLAGALVGFAFLTKQLQAFLVLPGLAAAFLWAAPVSLGRRVRDGLLAVGAMVVAAGWWVAVVELVPASMRPYIGGSQTNSFLELTFGYNGLGRLTGDETGSVGGGGPGGGTSMWGSTGLGRLFASDIGGQIAWLVPAALVLGAVAFWLYRRAPRTSTQRAEIVVWGAWLLVTGLTFSFMAGIFHAYYTVALAPAVAALVGIGSWALWVRRASLWALGTLAGVTVLTAVWSFTLLGRSADWLPWLRLVILGAGFTAAALLVAGHWSGRRMLRTGAALALVAGLAGPAAYTLDTVTSAKTGSIVSAGPAVAGGGMAGPGGRGGPQGGGPHGGGPQGGFGGPPPGAQAGGPAFGRPTGQTGQAPTGGFRGGGAGGLLGGATVSTQVEALLLEDSDRYRWVAAAIGSQNAASYQLATQESVMPVGGFNGSDPSPTLAQFQDYVSAGDIHWFIAGGGLGAQNGGSSASSDISAWVAANFTAQTVDGTTIYDLTAPSTGS